MFIHQVKTTRRSRSRYSRDYIKSDDGETGPDSPPKLKIKPVTPEMSTSEVDKNGESFDRLQVLLSNGIGIEGHKSAKKRRREKHRNRYGGNNLISKFLLPGEVLSIFR